MGLSIDASDYFAAYTRELATFRAAGESNVRTLGTDTARRMQDKGPRSDVAPHAIDTVEVTEGRGADTYFVDVGPSRKGFYLAFKEFGTRHQQAEPWARPAIAEAVAAWGP